MHRKRSLSTLTLPILAGLGLVAFAAGSGQAGSTSGPLWCEILADSANGGIALQGMVHTDVAISGSYRFRVASAGGGSANIQQGGNFSAAPGSPVALGRVTLGNAGAIYDASLEIAANGSAIKCTERVGGAI